MAKSNESVSDLYQKVAIERPLNSALDVVIFFLLVSLLGYRIVLLGNHGFCWVYAIAFVCECYFTFNWALTINLTWSPVDYKTYPQCLLKRMDELPPVDVFVTAADPVLEPPIITVNTVLSALAMEYPANKLGCYVSDDGGSPVTSYSVSEALNFAKIWVPFCKKYKVHVRAPFRYFSDDLAPAGSVEFQYEWSKMKDEYEELGQRIEEATENLRFGKQVGELSDLTRIKPNNHAPIIKIIWENKEGLQHRLPHLVYVSREKRPQITHRFKAGAMNVLTRVSGLMTNAPYILILDCDMFVNNPDALLQAMCLLQDPIINQDYAFVQFPQCFYDGLKDDPFGNHWINSMQLMLHGMAGIQGPAYIGSGCVHRRKVLYGQLPNEVNINEKYCDDELYKTFGNSKDFVTSVARALRSVMDYPHCLSNSIKATNEVATADYEHNSCWGSKVGWQYGSLVEDILTGMEIHKKGWKSAYITPTPAAFLGCAPSGSSPGLLTHQKRALTGHLEILTGKRSPIVTALFDKLEFRQRLFYVWMFLTAVSAVPEICYATLPAFSLIANSHFLPKAQEPVICIPLLLFILLNLRQWLEFFETGQSTRAWWNKHRMERIKAMSSSLLAMVAVLLKTLGLSERVFKVTKKDSPFSSSSSDREDLGHLTFDESPLFVPVTTVLMIQLAGLSVSFLGMEPSDREFGVGEVTCSVWLVLCFWPFLKGMFAKGSYGLPWSILFKASVLAVLFVYFCEINKFSF